MAGSSLLTFSASGVGRDIIQHCICPEMSVIQSTSGSVSFKPFGLDSCSENVTTFFQTVLIQTKIKQESHASSWTLRGTWEKNIGSFHLMVTNPAGTGNSCLLEIQRGRAGEVVQATPPQVAPPFVSPCSAPWQVMRDELGTCSRRVWHRH